MKPLYGNHPHGGDGVTLLNVINQTEIWLHHRGHTYNISLRTGTDDVWYLYISKGYQERSLRDNDPEAEAYATAYHNMLS